MSPKNLSAVREAVIAAVPDIQPKFFPHPSHGRPIRLADVLLAMQNKADAAIGVDLNGYFLDCNDDMTVWKILEYRWNLRKDDLSEQSKECIEFLYSLIVK